ncbi:MAG: UDP-N-acetylmuramoyl-tripeptide--D-alanyl-D-alanine ligase [Muribaculaceae bacterium]|nr:UDP-N-acetylmuramoyl-tripeptide--D-alanyl-D-alanine ligase [Muribaculaceae bacterium]
MLFPRLLLPVLIVLATIIFLDFFAVFKRDLMMLQLNSYRNSRYVNWFNQSGESTAPWRLGACVALFLILVEKFPLFLTALIAALILIANFFAYKKKKYKKPLVFTNRAKRIYIVMLILALATPVTLGLVLHNLLLACKIGILEIIISPAFLLIANLLLVPVEKSVNRKFIEEATSILNANKGLKVIGITGSYGKTSSKHFLYHILSQKYETVMTPGSYNTLLGVVRTIRELLKPYSEVFIVEMGAKQPNDIKEICNLVHPSIGLLTSVGEQHLETFKTVENIAKTKLELIDSLPSDGLGVVNTTNPIVLDKLPTDKQLSLYPSKGKDGYYITDVEYVDKGTNFVINGPDGFCLELFTPLVGKGNLENILGAVIVSRYLEVDEKTIIHAVSTMPQVEHRLSMTHTKGGFIILDDAFNSNPAGSSMALGVLSKIKVPGKRIIITPGMIELGPLQEEANKEFGKGIAKSADVAIIVGEYNRYPILEGMNEGGMNSKNIYPVASFEEAQKLFLTIVNKGDIVLYENDLPDTFK